MGGRIARAPDCSGDLPGPGVEVHLSSAYLAPALPATCQHAAALPRALITRQPFHDYSRFRHSRMHPRLPSQSLTILCPSALRSVSCSAVSASTSMPLRGGR